MDNVKTTCQECGGVLPLDDALQGCVVCTACFDNRGHGQSTLISPPKRRPYTAPRIERTERAEPKRVPVDVPHTDVETRFYAKEGRLVFEFSIPCGNETRSRRELDALLETVARFTTVARVQG